MLILKPAQSASNTEYMVLIKDAIYGRLLITDALNELYTFIPDERFNEEPSPILDGIENAKSYIIKFFCYSQSLKKTHKIPTII